MTSHMRSDGGWVASFSCPLAQRILQQFLCVTLWWPRHCVWGGLTVFYGVLCCAGGATAAALRTGRCLTTSSCGATSPVRNARRRHATHGERMWPASRMSSTCLSSTARFVGIVYIHYAVAFAGSIWDGLGLMLTAAAADAQGAWDKHGHDRVSTLTVARRVEKQTAAMLGVSAGQGLCCRRWPASHWLTATCTGCCLAPCAVAASNCTVGCKPTVKQCGMCCAVSCYAVLAAG